MSRVCSVFAVVLSGLAVPAVGQTTLPATNSLAAAQLTAFTQSRNAEIATVMGLTTKGVKSLLSRARTNLRTALSGYIFSDGEPIPEVSTEE